jgi:3-hydroxyisobutyrate dehydrogenase-like beta-hydroxyacid dehydrogenase
MNGIRAIGLLGFGEVGRILADDLLETRSAGLRVFDLLFSDVHSSPSRAAVSRALVNACPSGAELAAGCDLIISVVTASQANAAARSVAGSLEPGCLYLDLNSVSPQTRRDTATTIESAGGRFIEGVVMSPIEPHRIASPMLLGGPHTAEFFERVAPLGFTGARAFADDIGTASAVKMCRSVVIKGVEALLGESLAAARHYGVETEVLDSLGNVLPITDWQGKARYMISRSLLHGERRSEEMREAAKTVDEAGIDPHMSRATVVRQEWAAQFAAAVQADLPGMLDHMLGVATDASEARAPDG